MSKFYITLVRITLGVITHNIVYTRTPGDSIERFLLFDTYELAEDWIKGERLNGNRNMYQVQKIYIP